MYVQWISLFVLLSCAFVSGDRTVRTATGRVRSTTIELPDGKEVEGFLGIPFAEPPVGKLRFEKPIPITPWNGIYNATALPPPCYQNYTLKFYWTPDVERMTEDCLYLNVWVPGSVQDTKPKDVFVWIHGGAFNIGSSEMDAYNGALLASRGNIVVISLNYRVGMFGFLTTPLPEVSGNMGISDQVLALKWIKANVAAFGGDPELITLAGESAGAMSVALLVILPETAGMVKRAILQSGGIIHPMSGTMTESMIEIAEKVSRITGCSNPVANITTNPRKVVECLRHIPPNAISEAEGLLMKTYPITASPHICDGFMPREPLQMLKEGHFRNVEVLIGANKDEGSTFLTFVLPEYFGVYGLDAPILKDRLAAFMIVNVFAALRQKNTRDIAKFYVEGNGNRKMNKESNDNDDDDDDDVDYMKTALYDSIGDYMILCPAVFQADLVSLQSNSVYFYMFTYRPSTTVNAKWMGVTHFDEVPFVFGRPLIGDKNYTQDDMDISRRMMDRWIAFTKTGNPNIAGELQWPVYKWNEPGYLDINVEEKVRQQPDDYRCGFWRDRFRASIGELRTDSLTGHGISAPKIRAPIFLVTVSFILAMTVTK